MQVKQKRAPGIRRRLTLYMSAGFLLVLMAVSLLFLANYWSTMRQQIFYSLDQNYAQNAQAVSSKMEQMQDLATSMAVGYALNLFQIPQDASVSQQLQAYEALTDYLDAIEYAMQDIRIFYYPLQDAPVVHAKSRHYRPLDQEADLRQVLENGGRPVWLSMQETGSSYLALARAITDKNDFQQNIGVLAVAIDLRGIAGSLTPLAPGQILSLHLADGACLLCDGQLCSSAAAGGEGYFEQTLAGGQRVLVRSDRLLQDSVRLTSAVPDEYILGSLRRLSVWIGLSFLAAVVIIITYAGVTSKRLTGPLVELTKSISAAAKGSFKRLEIPAEQPEIQTLLAAYNTMSDRIGDLMQEQYRLGEEVNRAELQALQSQINPHFLYNTLDMVNWMAERNEKENIQRVIHAMSRFYRLALSRGSNTITIGEEIQLCETYLTIQQIRFPGRIHYEKDVEEDVLGYMIPKITLQPFVENAILHGLRVTQEAGGTVSVNGWMEEGRIVLAVTDDGVGMSEDALKRSLEHGGSHYGMKNIRSRLSIFYHEEIALEVESTPGAGTCVSINIPAVAKEENHA